MAIQTNSERLANRPTEHINVREYGATGLAVDTNQDVAIQAAFDAAFKSGGPGWVHFPEGRYVCSSRISLSQYRGGRITGVGNGGDWRTNTSSGYYLKMPQSVISWGGADDGTLMELAGVAFFEIDGIDFEGKDQTDKTKTDVLVQISDSSGWASGQTAFRNCSFHHAEYGVRCASSTSESNCSDIIFDNWHGKNMTSALRVENDQGLNFLVNYAVFGSVDTVFDFARGGCLTANMVTGTGIQWLLHVGRAGRNVGVFTINGVRLENDGTNRAGGVRCLTTHWKASTSYAVGDEVVNDSGKKYIVTTAGASAASGGPTGTGTGIADNTVVWNYVETVTWTSDVADYTCNAIVEITGFMAQAENGGDGLTPIAATFMNEIHRGCKVTYRNSFINAHDFAKISGLGSTQPSTLKLEGCQFFENTIDLADWRELQSFSVFKVHGCYDGIHRELDNAGGFTSEGWYADNVGAGVTAQVLTQHGNGTSEGLAFFNKFTPLRSGWLCGIWVKCNEARSAGTLTVEVFKNGNATGIQAVLDATNTTEHYAVVDQALYRFSALDDLDVKVTTDGSWAASASPDIRAHFDYKYD